MVKIKINGKEVEGREFQNMPQALAFAFQNGNCHIAEKLELETIVANTKGGSNGNSGKALERIKAEEEVARLAEKTEEKDTADNTTTTEPTGEQTQETTEPVTEPVTTEE